MGYESPNLPCDFKRERDALTIHPSNQPTYLLGPLRNGGDSNMTKTMILATTEGGENSQGILLTDDSIRSRREFSRLSETDRANSDPIECDVTTKELLAKVRAKKRNKKEKKMESPPPPSPNQNSDDDSSSQLSGRSSSLRRSNSVPLECTTMTTSTLSSSSFSERKKSSLVSPKNNNPKKIKRSVSFGDLRIRDYNVALSDHPECSFGPPVQLAWEYHERETLPLDSYEESRPPRREFPQQLLLGYKDRYRMLKHHAKCSKDECHQAMKEAERVKRGRMATELFRPLEETIETVIGKVQNVFSKFEN